jgi:hypothetical protein
METARKYAGVTTEMINTFLSMCETCQQKKNLRCFKLRLNRKLYVKHHADKLNVGDLFLRVLKCFSCLSEGRAKERKKERKEERKKERKKERS